MSSHETPSADWNLNTLQHDPSQLCNPSYGENCSFWFYNQITKPNSTTAWFRHFVPSHQAHLHHQQTPPSHKPAIKNSFLVHMSTNKVTWQTPLSWMIGLTGITVLHVFQIWQDKIQIACQKGFTCGMVGHSLYFLMASLTPGLWSSSNTFRVS